MLTGTVEVVGNGFLQIIGDNAANSIIIHQVGKAINPGQITIQIQGIGTKLLVAIPQNVTGPPTEFFPPANSVIITGVNSISVRLAGGNDSLSFYNIIVPGTFDIDMGNGNDTLTMSNVHDLFPGINGGPPGSGVPVIPSTTRIELGLGNDVAILNSVSAAVDFSIDGASGRDAISLYHVTAGTVDTIFPISHLSVDMGLGDFETLTAIGCSAVEGFFGDTGGHNGLLVRSGNHFTSETDTGFSLIV